MSTDAELESQAKARLAADLRNVFGCDVTEEDVERHWISLRARYLAAGDNPVELEVYTRH